MGKKDNKTMPEPTEETPEQREKREEEERINKDSEKWEIGGDY